MAVDELPWPRLYGWVARLATEVRQDFERSIEECLAWCNEDGVEPRNPYSGELTTRVGSELHGTVAAAAEGMRINSWIVRALRAASGSVARSTRLAEQATVEDG